MFYISYIIYNKYTQIKIMEEFFLMDPRTIVQITQNYSQPDNPVRIEKYLVVNNSSKNQFESYTIDRPRNYQWSEEYKQQIAGELSQLEQNKKLYDQICETQKPLMLIGSKSTISEDNLDGLLQLKGGDLSPLTKILFRIVLVWVMEKNAATTKGFMPGQINPAFGHPVAAGPAPRIAPKLQESPINRNNPNHGTCKKAPNQFETVKFNDGYKAEVGNVQLDHILVKHGHNWGINDIDLKNTKDANNNLLPGIPEQIRTRLTPTNREKLLTGIQDMASSPKLESYPNSPINGEMGRAYLCPDTGLFIGIDKNNIIRKAYVASENLINYLRTNCT
uniref:hypothetical protein n=1 Tax=Nitzschia dubiiformis TaxID=515482 RepID=UPI002114012D|nr:hypothetical protein NRL27_pgp045 [Nitzschia dubiiformis]UTQ75635.1 hypothetical protein [Nitzschia dubiiformis]